MKCEYCELRRVGPFVISKACTMLSGKLKNKQTGEPLKICMHHMTSPDPCMNGGDGCGPPEILRPQLRGAKAHGVERRRSSGSRRKETEQKNWKKYSRMGCGKEVST